MRQIETLQWFYPEIYMNLQFDDDHVSCHKSVCLRISLDVV